MKTAKDLLSYESPQVEIIEVEVEKGFIGSGDGESDGSGIGNDYTGGWG